MKEESLEYYSMRARAECEAALNASCPEARRAHAQLAAAYDRLAQISELERRGELPPGKVAGWRKRSATGTKLRRLEWRAEARG